MIKRRAYHQLLDWKKQSKGRTSLMIEGARRVGKSTLAEEFAKNEYRSYLLIDFSKEDQAIRDLFLNKRNDIEAFFSYLDAISDITFFERETLLIFDEIQMLPEARGFLKHLVADGRYDYIATGSLISIKRNVQNIVIPSEVQTLELNSLDFEEFLHALGYAQLADLLSQTITTLEPLPQGLHQKAMEHFREYMIVGGMPQAVSKYIETKDFGQVDSTKRMILDLYRNDIIRYGGEEEGRITAIFDQIPAQLAKKEKKFTISSLGEQARIRRYEEAFFWLRDSKIVNISHNATDPNVGLSLSLDHTSFKCFMADTGLLVTQAFADKESTSHEVYRAILFDRLGINEGMLMENIVAQQLHASGHRLFFYSRARKEDTAATEIDFLIQRMKGLKPRISPIEVKSSKRYKTASLDRFSTSFSKRLGKQYVLHTGNLEIEGERILTPLYLAGWL